MFITKGPESGSGQQTMPSRWNKHVPFLTLSRLDMFPLPQVDDEELYVYVYENHHRGRNSQVCPPAGRARIRGGACWSRLHSRARPREGGVPHPAGLCLVRGPTQVVSTRTHAQKLRRIYARACVCVCVCVCVRERERERERECVCVFVSTPRAHARLHSIRSRLRN